MLFASLSTTPLVLAAPARLSWKNIPVYATDHVGDAITDGKPYGNWFFDRADIPVEVCTKRDRRLRQPAHWPELGNMSIRRNPQFADVLQRIGFNEKAGTGIGSIRYGANEQGDPNGVGDDGAILRRGVAFEFGCFM